MASNNPVIDSSLARQLIINARVLIKAGATARDASIQTIDQYYGYTAEHASDPDAHRRDYAILEARLR